MAILVTGGCGFIGSNFILDWFSSSNEKVINLDNLNYASNVSNLLSLKNNNNYFFIKGSINDSILLNSIFTKYKPRAVVHFAAETHVDRSINEPSIFIETNILGSFKLLEEVRFFWNKLSDEEKKSFRFLSVSTDEVYGSLGINQKAFTEKSKYFPNSPYSASKASSDNLVRSYFQTYKIPTIITRCSNNYGPYQFPEKLIPLVILNIINKKNIPLYGTGENIRDWIFVNDHCEALRLVLKNGAPGETYNIGGNEEHKNINVIKKICDIFSEINSLPIGTYYDLITYVKDRPGHDYRYAIDSSKLKKTAGWNPKNSFSNGLRKTVLWYLENNKWLDNITNESYLLEKRSNKK
mgnify:CR=1 FL=1|tara:strand:- start:1975 stop:3030 length:1056 start_codon:yes stop_codon:yes gene_type:complete